MNNYTDFIPFTSSTAERRVGTNVNPVIICKIKFTRFNLNTLNAEDWAEVKGKERKWHKDAAWLRLAPGFCFRPPPSTSLHLPLVEGQHVVYVWHVMTVLLLCWDCSRLSAGQTKSRPACDGLTEGASQRWETAMWGSVHCGALLHATSLPPLPVSAGGERCSYTINTPPPPVL